MNADITFPSFLYSRHIVAHEFQMTTSDSVEQSWVLFLLVIIMSRKLIHSMRVGVFSYWAPRLWNIMSPPPLLPSQLRWSFRQIIYRKNPANYLVEKPESKSRLLKVRTFQMLVFLFSERKRGRQTYTRYQTLELEKEFHFNRKVTGPAFTSLLQLSLAFANILYGFLQTFSARHLLWRKKK